MGICQSDFKKRRPYKSIICQNQEDSNEQNLSHTPIPIITTKKKQNLFKSDLLITENKSKTIIKSIGQINGKEITINNNNDCIILIMDYSYSIIIENCENCSMFLAPCETSIIVNNCKYINIVSVSANLTLKNIEQSNLYIFVSNNPVLEKCSKIKLGYFFIQYTEIQEMFHKSKINIWQNKWSSFKKIGKNCDINYSDDITKLNVVNKFMSKFPDCYINVDQHQFVPLTYGKSIIQNEKNVNFILIFKYGDFQENEILKLILPEEIENRGAKLISTLIVQEKSQKFDLLMNIFQKNKKNRKIIDYLNKKITPNDQNYKSIENTSITPINPSDKNRLNVLDLTSNNDLYTCSNHEFLSKDDILFLWLKNEDNNFNSINEYLDFCLDSNYIGWLDKKHFNCNDEIEFGNLLLEIFELE